MFDLLVIIMRIFVIIMVFWEYFAYNNSIETIQMRQSILSDEKWKKFQRNVKKILHLPLHFLNFACDHKKMLNFYTVFL